MSPFSEEYYMEGPKWLLSNYTNYSWQGNTTVACADKMMAVLGGKKGDTVHDFGCARGYYVKALMMLGYQATGHDISTWAIENCDPFVSHAVSNFSPKGSSDWILCKDVLEHIPEGILKGVVGQIVRLTGKGALIIVPMTASLGSDYLNPADRKDSTHVIAWPLPTWLVYIQRIIETSGESLIVSGGYSVPGVKQAAEPFPGSTGFITLKRV